MGVFPDPVSCPNCGVKLPMMRVMHFGRSNVWGFGYSRGRKFRCLSCRMWLFARTNIFSADGLLWIVGSQALLFGFLFLASEIGFSVGDPQSAADFLILVIQLAWLPFIWIVAYRVGTSIKVVDEDGAD